mmetsp:Transcript_1836/g.1286  ORF Transcript_1836/g.1286 Transcript_1836/m.1286 type:complete len:175 (+) Transcript_1836:467-991(+)
MPLQAPHPNRLNQNRKQLLPQVHLQFKKLKQLPHHLVFKRKLHQVQLLRARLKKLQAHLHLLLRRAPVLLKKRKEHLNKALLILSKHPVHHLQPAQQPQIHLIHLQNLKTQQLLQLHPVLLHLKILPRCFLTTPCLPLMNLAPPMSNVPLLVVLAMSVPAQKFVKKRLAWFIWL